MVFPWALGSILTMSDLMPVLVTSCRVVLNEVCPCVALSVKSVPSLGVMW